VTDYIRGNNDDVDAVKWDDTESFPTGWRGELRRKGRLAGE